MGQIVFGNGRRTAGFARDHDAVGGRQRFAGDTNLTCVPAIARAEFEEGIDDLIGDAVADLVGMTFRNGFTGE